MVRVDAQRRDGGSQNDFRISRVEPTGVGQQSCVIVRPAEKAPEIRVVSAGSELPNIHLPVSKPLGSFDRPLNDVVASDQPIRDRRSLNDPAPQSPDLPGREQLALVMGVVLSPQ